jgi:hypothetical protein
MSEPRDLETANDEKESRPCFHHRFLDDPCPEPAVYVSCGLGNLVDGWTWCINHPPSKDFRRELRTR